MGEVITHKERKEGMDCINPKHGGKAREARVRGLCVSCYHSVLTLVKRGEVTMEGLEGLGKIHAATERRARKKLGVGSWFTEGVSDSAVDL